MKPSCWVSNSSYFTSTSTSSPKLPSSSGSSRCLLHLQKPKDNPLPYEHTYENYGKIMLTSHNPKSERKSGHALEFASYLLALLLGPTKAIFEQPSSLLSLGMTYPLQEMCPTYFQWLWALPSTRVGAQGLTDAPKPIFLRAFLFVRRIMASIFWRILGNFQSPSSFPEPIPLLLHLWTWP